MKILLIAGHGDGDPGACGCGHQEAALTRELASVLKPKLSQYAEVTLFDTSKNMYKYLKNGGSFDFIEYNYVLELHFNACVKDAQGDGRTTGTEILIHTLENGSSVEEAIVNAIAALGLKNRGVKRRSDLLNMNTCKRKQGVSYALLETCFIDDRDDMNIYNVSKIADAVTAGIAAGFGFIKEEQNMAGFKDTNGHYAETHIADIKNMGIVNDDGSGNFNPDKPITRADAAIMIRNAIRYITGK